MNARKGLPWEAWEVRLIHDPDRPSDADLAALLMRSKGSIQVMRCLYHPIPVSQTV
jgi:hypothetical protein